MQQVMSDPFSTLEDFDIICGGMLYCKPKPPPKPSKTKAKVKSFRTPRPLPSKRQNSFASLQASTSKIPRIEPQKEGTVAKACMCSNSAKRFISDLNGKHRCGLLFGSVSSEVVKEPTQSKLQSRARARSGGTNAVTAHKVIKVHCVYRVPQTPSSSSYDSSSLLIKNNNEISLAVKLASMLDLKVVGWLYSYDHPSESDESLYVSPLTARDVVVSSKLQSWSKEKEFVTFAVDARSGSMEGFQISDQILKMVADGSVNASEDNKEKRDLNVKDEVLVDGMLCNKFDSLLCLINTAVETHVGYFCGELNDYVRKNKKNKKDMVLHRMLLNAIEDDAVNSNNEKLLGKLCDFNTLLYVFKNVNAESGVAIADAVKRFGSNANAEKAVIKKKRIMIDQSVVKETEDFLRGGA